MALTVGQSATLACSLEVAAPKVGNVNRGADFDDLTLSDFLAAAVAIAPAMDNAVNSTIGKTVLAGAQATRAVVDSNVNLGILLLFAPLAAARGELRAGVNRVLSDLTVADGDDVYAAIRLMNPGGLGEVAEHDVAQSAAPPGLLEAMQLAAKRDLVARQYTNDFAQVFDDGLPWIQSALSNGASLANAIVHTHVQFMAKFPDSLIARKCGVAVAEESSLRAKRVLEAGSLNSDDYLVQLQDLDFWLRCDHHRRNPGTSADLIAASLFAGLLTGAITAPFG